MKIQQLEHDHIVIRNSVREAGNWVAVYCELGACGVAHINVCENLGFGAGEVGAENDISTEVRCGEREPIGFLARLHRWHIVGQHQSLNASPRRSFRRVFNIRVIIQNVCCA